MVGRWGYGGSWYYCIAWGPYTGTKVRGYGSHFCCMIRCDSCSSRWKWLLSLIVYTLDRIPERLTGVEKIEGTFCTLRLQGHSPASIMRPENHEQKHRIEMPDFIIGGVGMAQCPRSGFLLRGRLACWGGVTASDSYIGCHLFTCRA